MEVLGEWIFGYLAAVHAEVEEELRRPRTTQTVLALLHRLLRTLALQTPQAQLGGDVGEILVGIRPGVVPELSANHLRLARGVVHSCVAPGASIDRRNQRSLDVQGNLDDGLSGTRQGQDLVPLALRVLVVPAPVEGHATPTLHLQGNGFPPVPLLGRELSAVDFAQRPARGGRGFRGRRRALSEAPGLRVAPLQGHQRDAGGGQGELQERIGLHVALHLGDLRARHGIAAFLARQ
mmetsp:Transcript_12515/g.31226  ORF Transcript_12515/g.31226 Transcript_12515/m.31226 type:complete len:236 (-) Transcript_12515:610-1317(-)